ncbi:MAG TPA: VWA domain-containing protein [Phycisphaerae bacterium]|nr:VWA domain-containing protein [Phycisphaerae bacterium]
MVFVHPLWLWMLVPVVLLAGVHLTPRLGLSGARAGFVIGLRCAAYVLLVLALARPLIERGERSRTVVAVVDLSASVGDADLKAASLHLQALARQIQPNERLRLVVFDRAAREVQPGTDGLAFLNLAELRSPGSRLPSVASQPLAGGSALADALELAGAMIPDRGDGRIVLFSDGLETGGDARAAAFRLAQRRISIEGRTLGGRRIEEVVLRSVSLPPAAAVGSTVDLIAEVQSASATPGRLVVRRNRDGREITQAVNLVADSQVVTMPLVLDNEGLAEYAVSIESPADSLDDNNTLTAAVEVLPPREVGVVEENPAAPATAALAAMLGKAARVTRLPLEDLGASDALSRADLLVIADTMAERLGPDLQARIRERVIRGTGLLVAGGRRSFGPGGYAGTPVAEVMPVRFSQEIERQDPSTTLVIIIDTSGSMGETRVNLAREVARLAISRLSPHDKVGIVEFYGAKRWAAPIQPASNAIDLQRALNRLSSSGGTVILPAIEEAYYALQNVHTRTKHVLVLTDGGVETGAFEPLIRKMADHRMTVSTVMVGPGAHSAFLSSLAHWGRGRFYASPDRFNLPEVIVKQPESSMLTPFVEQPSSLTVRRADAVTGGIDFGAAPALQGYVQTEARPTADLLLVSSLGHPILVRWHFGLGAVAAFTSQLGGEWTRDLSQWPSFARLMSTLARGLYGPSVRQALWIEPLMRPGAVELRVANRMPGAGTGNQAVELRVVDGAGLGRRWTLDPVSPDEWNHRVAGLPPGTYRVSAALADDSRRGEAALVVPPAREVSAVCPDEVLMQDLADMGRQVTMGARAESAAAKTTIELWPWLAAAVLVLLLLNVAVRRWPGRVIRAAAAAVLGGLIGVVSAAPCEAAAASQASSQPASAPVSLSAAIEAKARGDLETAERVLIELTRNGPADARLLGELARIEELRGNDKAALATLEKAVAAGPGEEELFALRIRQAMIVYDTGDKAAAGGILRDVASRGMNGVGGARFCAHLASLCGDDALAVELLKPGAGGERTEYHDHLFRGLFLLRIGRPVEAGPEFELAYARASLARDRQYALERMVAASRDAGTLGRLADKWLTLDKLSSDRLAMLVAILRELNRSDDAMQLLTRPAQTPEQAELLQSSDFQKEVVAIALGAGRAKEAEAAYLKLLARDPRQVVWRVSLARLRLLDGRREEAVELFSEAQRQFDDVASLMGVADGARQLALDDAALAAARKAGSKSTADRVRSVLFEADLVRLRGGTDRAIALVHEVIPAAREDPRLLQPVAEALERYGDKAESLRLFRQIYEKTKAEDVLLLVAWLLESNQRLGEAFDLWRNLWQTTQVPARLKQAEERMLDLAARTGRLADLAVEIEEQLDAGQADDRRLSLLVDIYTAANDAVSAAEILNDFGRRSGRQVEMLKRLAKVYLHCEQFGRCNATLRRLVEVDSANAADHLQQLALVALERQRPQDAKAALAELYKVAASDPTTEEFGAGVLNMIGLHEEAARAYERVLEGHGDHIEVLLLWSNALKAAGQAERAVVRFQNLVEETEEDDLFTVAVDGLLNLQARPAVMRSAVRRVYARIAARPEKVFLYPLAVDLLETMNRRERMESVLEQCVVVAGERRGALLRELMEGAKADGRVVQQVDFGRSLLALGEEVPPGVFLDLGEAMVKQGKFALAERVFERAALDGDFSAVQQQVASYYEDANLPAHADRIIRELLIGEPDNVRLLIRSGALSEQLGQHDRAFGQYYRAADLMLRRLPGTVGSDTASQPQGRPDAAEGQPRTTRANNLDEMAQFFEASCNGLLNAARGEAHREQLRKDVLKRIDDELIALGEQGPGAARIARHPRLDRLTRFLRQVAFSIHRPEVADEVDERLLERYSQDTALRAMIVRTRLDWGLYSRAATMARPGIIAGRFPDELALTACLTEPARLGEAIAKGEVTAALGVRLVPVLIMLGRDDQARFLLKEMKPLATVEFDKERTVPTMVAAAIALDDAALVQRWLAIWLDGCRRIRKGDALARSLEECVRLVWNRLAEQDRTRLLDEIVQMAGALDEKERIYIDQLRMKIAEGLGQAFAELDALLQSAAQQPSLGAETLAQLLEKAAAGRRPELIRTMVSAAKPADQRMLILGLVGRLTVQPGAELADTLVSLFRSAPKARVSGERVAATLAQTRRNRNAACPDVGYRLGEILLSENPTETAVLASVAVARETAGKHDEALPLINEALENLLDGKQMEFEQKRLLDSLVGIMRPADLDAAITDLADRQEIEPPTATLKFVHGLLLEAADRHTEALTAFRGAFELMPGNRIFSRKVITAMKECQRCAQLASLLSSRLTKSTIMESYEWRTLTELYYDLFNPLAALSTVSRDETPLAPVEMMRILRRLGRHEDVRTTFRRFMTRNRDDGRFYTPFWPPDSAGGGMVEFFDKQRTPMWKRMRLFEALADMPFAEEEYTGMLVGARPERRDVPGLIDGLLKAARINGTRNKLIEALLDAQERDAMTAKDRLMLLALAAEDPAALPAPLAESLAGMVPHLEPTDTVNLTTPARVCLSRGQAESARHILRWLLAADLLKGRTMSRTDDRFNRIDLYLASWPEPQRPEQKARLTALLSPTPVDDLSEEYDSAWLDRLTAEGDRAEVDRQVERMRRHLGTDTTAARYGELRAAIARRDAAAGRFDAFQVQAKCLLDMVARNDEVLTQQYDTRDLLPPAGEMADPGRFLNAIVSDIQARRAAGTFRASVATRHLCLMASWAAEQGLRREASALVQGCARELGQEPDADWLWIADAARLCNDDALAVDLETRLLGVDMLPVVRVPSLLEAVERARGQAAADELATRVAGYSDHPVVLGRAIRRAQQRDDGDAARRYRARLDAVSPRPSATTASSRPGK